MFRQSSLFYTCIAIMIIALNCVTTNAEFNEQSNHKELLKSISKRLISGSVNLNVCIDAAVELKAKLQLRVAACANLIVILQNAHCDESCIAAAIALRADLEADLQLCIELEAKLRLAAGISINIGRRSAILHD